MIDLHETLRKFEVFYKMVKEYPMPKLDSNLWIERLPVRLGFERGARMVTGREGLGSYLFVTFVVGIDIAASIAAMVLYDHTPPLLLNPFWLLLPIGLLLAVWSARMMQKWYDSMIKKIDIEQRATSFEATEFNEILPSRVRTIVYLLAILFYAIGWASSGIGVILSTIGPIIGFLKWGVLVPLVYLPIVIEWGVMILGIHLILPRQVRNSEFELDFSDPLNFGGMYEFGALLKYSYYMYVGALLLFLLWRYGEALTGQIVQTPYAEPTMVHTAQFAAAWILGVGFLCHSLYVFHAHMSTAKEKKLEEINQRIRDLGDDSYSLPETDPDPELVDRVRFEYEQMQFVKETREFPIGFSMSSQILFSALLPVLIERVFSIVL